MQPSDKLAFAELLTGVCDYYEKEISTFTLNLFWNGLKHHDLSEISAAFASHIANPDTGQFRPKIADVARALLGSTKDQAAMAWSKVDAAVRHVGHYVDLVLDDAIIHRVIADIGGWTSLNSKPDKEWPFIQLQFEARYRAYRARNEVPEYPSLLLGIANAQNLQHGFPIQPPTFMGDPDKCRQVYDGGSLKSSVQITHARTMLIPPVRKSDPILELAASPRDDHLAIGNSRPHRARAGGGESHGI